MNIWEQWPLVFINNRLDWFSVGLLHIECPRHISDIRSGTNDHDLAVLHLCSPLQWRPQVQPVCLPHTDHAYDGVTALVSGWGTTSSGDDQEVSWNMRNNISSEELLNF